MSLRYDKETDTLSIIFGPDRGDSYQYDAGSFSVCIDDMGALLEISIEEFSGFITRALAARVKKLSAFSRQLSAPRSPLSVSGRERTVPWAHTIRP